MNVELGKYGFFKIALAVGENIQLRIPLVA